MRQRSKSNIFPKKPFAHCVFRIRLYLASTFAGGHFDIISLHSIGVGSFAGPLSGLREASVWPYLCENHEGGMRSPPEQDSVPGNDPAGRFSTTHWSVVLQAGVGSSPKSAEALEKLCRNYWYPLYAYVRRKGHGPHDAQDLTQEFFARFLERKYVSLADRSRGRFRSFLLVSLQHFLVNEWQKTQTAKRGGAHRFVSLNQPDAEVLYLAEPADDLAPDRIFEKRWATGLLDQVLARLRREYAVAGKDELFEALKVFVWGERNTATYQEMAMQLGMSEGAVKVAVHRLRQRYRELLRAQVAQTVSSAEEIDEELRHLIAMVSG
jgi:RNA polymerase sigma-70 factor (ECF subfamily)